MKLKFKPANLIKSIQNFSWLNWILIGGFLFTFAGAAGLGGGYLSGVNERQENRQLAKAIELQAQYDLGVEDLESGRYELARQRFEYVIQQDPEFPGVLEKLAEVLLKLPESNLPTAEALPSTPTPTPDTRSLEDLFTAAQSHLQNQEWKNLRQTIVSLRDIDPLFQVTTADKMMYLALRMGGIEKILNDGDLEGGVYDLAMAEKFVPLDSEANIYREWARLYQLGISFWGIYPEKSAFYFGQIASAAPYLKDLSGMFASERYRLALLQYGDRLAQAGDWCSALEQFNLAQSFSPNPAVDPTATFAEQQCSSPEEEIPLDSTPTPPETEPQPISPTPTFPISPTVTPTPESTGEANTPTSTSTNTVEIQPTATQTVIPSPSPTTETASETQEGE